MIKNKKFELIFFYWLILLIFLLISMIAVGGLTRLTDSGLSITRWELFKGIIPPLNIETWQNYFSLYKKIPQYILINNQITLEEFKVIYYWEYLHRLLGRFIGLIFLLPFIYFIYKKILNKKTLYQLFSIFLLILTQGLIGWYMVKSGLTENISVSHYRLAIHLSIAFVILSSLVWILMNLIRNTGKNFFNFSKDYFILKTLIILFFFQIIIGAFVSGLDAGRIYNTWPLMNNNYFPNDIDIQSYRDIFNFNSHSLVQFFHRNLAYIIFFLSMVYGVSLFKSKKREVFNCYIIYFLLLLTQVFLGILVLLTGNNLYFASFHQISSIFLIISLLNLYHKSMVQKF